MRRSAGILLYKKIETSIKYLLVHPGGPFWENKDKGSWSIPKGEYLENEDPLKAAIREMEEETGYKANGPFITLSPIIQKAGKQVMAWANYGDLDVRNVKSNTFKMEWPYKSGKWITVPEIDKAAWFDYDEAIIKINPAQIPFLNELKLILEKGNVPIQ